VYMWICRTTKIKPSAEGFASEHQVHHQRRTVFEEEGDQSVEKDCQFGCLNFIQVRRGEPSDCVSEQVALGLATALVLLHGEPPYPQWVSPPGYEGAATSSRVLREEPLVPRRR
jgi:hypothetical protein